MTAANIFRLLAVALYLCSLALTPYHAKEPVMEMRGILVLLVGWAVIPDAHVFAWIANPLAIFCFIRMRKSPALCVGLALAALAFAHDFRSVESLGFDSGREIEAGTVVGFGAGSYVWLSSLLLTLVASILSFMAHRRARGSKPMVTTPDAVTPMALIGPNTGETTRFLHKKSSMKILSYPYRPKPLSVVFAIALFGVATFVLRDAAQTNDRGLVINGLIRLGPGEATIFYWCMTALSAAFVVLIAAVVLRSRFFPQRVTLTANELAAPRSRLALTPTVLRLYDIQRVYIGVTRKKRSLKIVHPWGELAVLESWLPSPSDFDALYHAIESRRSEIANAVLQRKHAESAGHPPTRRHAMKRHLLVAAAMLGAMTTGATAAEPIPADLVGVWASDSAVLKGSLLFEGQALYLGADGVGALVGGPPPIGIKIQAVFNSATNSLHFDLIEHGKVIGHGSASYDPSQKVIDSGGARHELLRRRSSELTDETKKALGL